MAATASLSAQSSASLADSSVVHVDSAPLELNAGMGYMCNESPLYEVKENQSTLKDTLCTAYMNSECVWKSIPSVFRNRDCLSLIVSSNSTVLEL